MKKLKYIESLTKNQEFFSHGFIPGMVSGTYPEVFGKDCHSTNISLY